MQTVINLKALKDLNPGGASVQDLEKNLWVGDRLMFELSRGPLTGRCGLVEMFWKIGGRRMYLWCAVDDEGDVLDVIVQHGGTQRSISWNCGIFTGPAYCETTTVLRARICRSNGESESSRGPNPKPQRKDFSQSMRRSTTASTSNVI